MLMTMMSSPLLLMCLLCAFLPQTSAEGLVESERLEEYKARNYTWPLEELVPNTPGWRRIIDRRFQQIEAMEGGGQRYEGYMQTMSSALTVPNFTENGWGLTRVNNDLLEALQKGIRDGLPNASHESRIEVIEGDEPPLFINRPDLTKRVLKEVQPLCEAWSQTPLEEYRAYGFRLYQNNSRLFMHTDKTATHIVSAILHIDRSEDAEPWPIVIEDYQGNTNEVLLEPGDLLFYESSKCWHGRPKRFKGSWYTSVFIHYYPVGWDDHDSVAETHYSIPPQWSADPTPTNVDRAVMVGTAMKEPDCPDEWCGLKDAVKWQGGGIEGEVLTTNHHKYDLKHWRDEL
mmetsp:Transcript_28874/g.52229  ORF Transcript_28874/g.52229 Transcript_28874/m.52229 type:complete len:344 (+) Transcript_28874:17-1048(+)